MNKGTAVVETVTPRDPNYVDVVVTDRQGRVRSTSHSTNLRTNAGADFQANQMSGTSAAVANYIGVSTDATAAAATDTSLASEQTTNGLARAAGTFSHTTGTTSYTLAKTFTYTGGTAITLAKAAMFNAASAGTMVFEALFGSTATLVNGDQITISWTVSI